MGRVRKISTSYALSLKPVREILQSLAYYHDYMPNIALVVEDEDEEEEEDEEGTSKQVKLEGKILFYFT